VPALSKRQQTMQTLFPRRPKALARPQQLTLAGIHGEGWLRIGRCPSCANELEGSPICEECDGFTCVRCDGWTSANGGDGTLCARCSR
jgi:hypothetical protein